jgi:hypothetical protein
VGSRFIRWSTGLAVLGVALVAAIVSYRHAYELVVRHGETGATARMVPLTVDGLVYASSMVLWHSARQGRSRPPLAGWALAAGVAATVGANLAHGLGHGPIGALVAVWPAVSLVLSYELFMLIIRSGVQPRTTKNTHQDNANNPAEVIAAISETHTDITPQPNGRQNRPQDRQDNETANEDSTYPDDELFAAAQKIAADYRNTHGQWIPRDELRARLHCSTQRANELLRMLKTASPNSSND